MKNENRTLEELLTKCLTLLQPEREEYLNNLLNLARLRPKRLNTLHKEVQKMPITINFGRNPLFLKGIEKSYKGVINLYKELNLSPEKLQRF